jgi:hypothetical protein
MRETRRRQPAAALARYAMGLAALALGLGAEAANLTRGEGRQRRRRHVPLPGQEDTTFQVDQSPPRADMLAFNFHASNHRRCGGWRAWRADAATTHQTMSMVRRQPRHYYNPCCPYPAMR